MVSSLKGTGNWYVYICIPCSHSCTQLLDQDEFKSHTNGNKKKPSKPKGKKKAKAVDSDESGDDSDDNFPIENILDCRKVGKKVCGGTDKQLVTLRREGWNI